MRSPLCFTPSNGFLLCCKEHPSPYFGLKAPVPYDPAQATVPAGSLPSARVASRLFHASLPLLTTPALSEGPFLTSRLPYLPIHPYLLSTSGLFFQPNTVLFSSVKSPQVLR